MHLKRVCTILSLLLLISITFAQNHLKKPDFEKKEGWKPSEKKADSTIKVAGLQMDVTNDIVQNKNRILSGIKEAAVGKAIFLETPEGSLSGYHCKFNQKELLTALQEIISYAKELKLGLLLGTCFKDDSELCYNQIRVYTPEGVFLGAIPRYLIVVLQTFREPEKCLIIRKAFYKHSNGITSGSELWYAMIYGRLRVTPPFPIPICH